jgi:hypothetical protein
MRKLLLTLVCLGCLLAGGTRADDTSEFFNGKDTDGWEGLPQFWKVENGAIIGSSDKNIPFNTFLCSKKEYGDFELSFQVRLKGGKGNSGVQIRSRVHNKEKLAVTGPQADIGAGFWGSLYGENFGGMMKASDAKKINAVLKKDDFNDYSIKCVGKKVTIKVNGETAVDDEFLKMPEKGIIALQLHGGPPMEVTFKDIKFKDLSKK